MKRNDFCVPTSEKPEPTIPIIRTSQPFRTNILHSRLFVTYLHRIIRLCRIVAILLFLVSPGQEISAQPFIFSSVQTDIASLNYGSVALADLNGDGQMDVLYTGNTKSGNPFRSNSAVAMNLSIPGSQPDKIQFDVVSLPTEAFLGQASWSDYDLDGDLDFILTGTTAVSPPYSSVSLLFNNSDGAFTPVDAGLPGVYSSTVRWGDVDNDGDEDLFLSGQTADGASMAAIYRNDRAEGFHEMETPLFQALFGDAAWGDYDNDADLDLVVTGITTSGRFITQLFVNDGFGTLTDSGQSLQGFAFSSVEWGDFDGDGDLDLITSGAALAVADIFHGETILYRNDAGDLRRTGDAFGGVFYGDLTWGDYDLDGDLDLFVMGRASLDGSHLGIMYRNDEGSFTEVTGLVGTSTANAEWIDFDADNDLDIFVVGQNLSGVPFSRLYRNDNRLINRVPIAPSELSSVVNENDVLLTWEPGDDLETATSTLTYNVSVGTAPGQSDILSAQADTDTGKRWRSGPGNVGHNLTWKLNDLPVGLYYWRVQTVDNSFVGSPFSEDRQFTVSVSGKVATEVDEDTGFPGSIMLYAPYPNPTRTATTFRYDLKTSAPVELDVYDVLGQRISRIVSAYQPAGSYQNTWSGRSDSGNRVGAGVYFVRLRAGSAVFSQKLIVLQ